MGGDGAVGEFAVAGVHVGGAGAEEGLLLDHGGLALALKRRGEGAGGFGAEVRVAVGGEDAFGDDGGSGDLAALDEGAGVAGFGVGGGGAGGEEPLGHLAGVGVEGVVAAEGEGVVRGRLAGGVVDHADLPEAFFHGWHVGEVGGVGGGEEEQEGQGEGGFFHGVGLSGGAME